MEGRSGLYLQPPNRRTSAQLQAGGRNGGEAERICCLQAEPGSKGGSLKVPATAPIHSLIAFAAH